MKDNEILKITIFGVILSFVLTIGGYFLQEWICGSESIEEIQDDNR